jgi:AAA family ATP:ADP antiporter
LQQKQQQHRAFISSIMVKTRGGSSSPAEAESTPTIDPADSANITAADTNTTTTTATTTTGPTSKLSWTDVRRTLFPIYGKEEVNKFLLIGSIKFFVILALTLTRDTKDTLIVTQCGAEAIAFLKVS